MIRIKFECWWASSTDINSRILNQYIPEKDLDSMIFSVFGYYSPKLVIITTPNYDFNYFFPEYSK